MCVELLVWSWILQLLFWPLLSVFEILRQQKYLALVKWAFVYLQGKLFCFLQLFQSYWWILPKQVILASVVIMNFLRCSCFSDSGYQLNAYHSLHEAELTDCVPL